MPTWKAVTRSVLIVCAATIFASCASTRSTPARDQSVEDLEDSGKRLSGDFVVSSIDDAYRDSRVRAQSSVAITFDEGGRFKRESDAGSEEGSYIISGTGEIVIYIEKLNGEFLTSARAERYSIDDQRDEALTLKEPSRTLVLRKR